MIIEPAHGASGTEEANSPDLQKNNFEMRGDGVQHQEARRGNNDPRARQQKGSQPRRDRRDAHGWVVLDKPIGRTSTLAFAVL